MKKNSELKPGDIILVLHDRDFQLFAAILQTIDAYQDERGIHLRLRDKGKAGVEVYVHSLTPRPSRRDTTAHGRIYDPQQSDE